MTSKLCARELSHSHIHAPYSLHVLTGHMYVTVDCKLWPVVPCYAVPGNHAIKHEACCQTCSRHPWPAVANLALTSSAAAAGAMLGTDLQRSAQHFNVPYTGLPPNFAPDPTWNTLPALRLFAAAQLYLVSGRSSCILKLMA